MLHDKHFETDEIISCEIDNLITPFYNKIHQPILCVDNSDECIFFFLVFPWIKLHLIPLFFVNCSAIPLRYFWWNYFLSNFKFSWWFVETSLFVNGMVYSYLIMIIDQQSVDTFSDDTCSSTTVFILLQLEHHSIASCDDHFFFFFFRLFLINSISVLIFESSVIYCLTCFVFAFLADSCAFLDAVNAGYHKKAVPLATGIASNNLRNNFRRNIFWCVHRMSQDLDRMLPCLKNFWQPIQKHLRERESEEKRKTQTQKIISNKSSWTYSAWLFYLYYIWIWWQKSMMYGEVEIAWKSFVNP